MLNGASSRLPDSVDVDDDDLSGGLKTWSLLVLQIFMLPASFMIYRRGCLGCMARRQSEKAVLRVQTVEFPRIGRLGDIL